MSLADYVARMKDGQEHIYYVLAEGRAAARSSPFIERLRAKGIEVLLLGDRVDAWIMGQLHEFDGKPFQVAQGTNPGQAPVNFYFDQSSGLLTRIVRWNRTKVGAVPSQMDFSDYRDVGGVKMPFKMVVTWTDGQSHIELNEITPNANIPATRFAKPAEPTVKPRGAK